MNILTLFAFSALTTFSTFAAFSPANRPIDAKHYIIKLAIDPSENPDRFQAVMQMKLRLTKSARSFSLDADKLRVEKIKLLKPYAKKLRFQHKGDELTVRLPRRMKSRQLLTVEIHYSGKIYEKEHLGLFKVKDPDEPERGPLLFTQFEVLGARRFFPCNDEPYDKASTEIHTIVPEQYEVVSNGKQTRKRKIRKNEQTWHEIRWSQKKAHSTYLVSLAIAPFAKLTLSKNPEVSLYVGKTKVEKARYGGEATHKLLGFLEDYLGVKYPWSKYATVGVPTFFWGGDGEHFR